MNAEGRGWGESGKGMKGERGGLYSIQQIKAEGRGWGESGKGMKGERGGLYSNLNPLKLT